MSEVTSVPAFALNAVFGRRTAPRSSALCAKYFRTAGLYYLCGFGRTNSSDTGRKGTYSEKLYQVHAGEGNHTERPVKPKLLYHRKFKTGELMIPLDKETFEAYMERLLEQVEKVVGALDKKNKKPQNYLNGERLYDNQDVCLLLNISKRTLQRYRDNGLKYYTILHKTYYREKDLHEFIRRYFDGENVEKGKTKECNGDERIEGGMLSDDKDEPMEEDKPVDEGKLTEDA